MNTFLFTHIYIINNKCMFDFADIKFQKYLKFKQTNDVKLILITFSVNVEKIKLVEIKIFFLIFLSESIYLRC